MKKLFMGLYPMSLEQAQTTLISLEIFISNAKKSRLKVDNSNLIEFEELKKFIANY